jgi:hypothetical protein
LWLYGAVGASFAAFHLGGAKPKERLSERLEVDTHALYDGAAAAGEERTRHVRILAPCTRRARRTALDDDHDAGYLRV